MCFHNALSVESQNLEHRYKAEFSEGINFKPIYHASAFQHPEWPVITNDLPSKIQIFKWGLIPFFTKSAKDAEEIKKLTVNARLETILQKRSFSIPAKHKHCIIPSTGFFEWQHTGKLKIPWFIRVADEEIFSIAGLWDTWINPENTKQIHTFSIVTVEAKGIMEQIHNTKKKMPLVCSRDNEKEWLSGNVDKFIQNQPGYNGIFSFSAYTVAPISTGKTINIYHPEVQSRYNYYKNGELF